MTNFNSKESLLSSFSKGEMAAILFLKAEFYPKLQKMVLSNSGNMEDAEDLFHDTLIIAIKKSRKNELNNVLSLPNYLLGISKFLWLKELERRKKKTVITNELKNELINAGFTHKIDELDHMYAVYLRKFQELDEVCQKLFLEYFKKKGFQEIAQSLGYSYDSIRQKKMKCLKKLKDLIHSTL